MLTITIPDFADSSHSRTYNLRCWVERDGKGQHLAWRFSLKEVGEKEWHGFADFDALVSHLTMQFISHSIDGEGEKNAHRQAATR